MTDFPIQVATRYTLLTLSGEIDLQCAAQVRKQILQPLPHKKNLFVDLSAVEYIDSFSVATLVEERQLSKTRQLPFGLINVSHAVQQVFGLARLDPVLPIYASLDALK